VLLRGVRAKQLLGVLHEVDVDGVLLLMEHANVELVVKLCNGPLEDVVTRFAGSLALVLRHDAAAKAVGQVTDSLNSGLQAAAGFVQDVRDTVDRGKTSRGSQAERPYVFGDFTRGLLAQRRDGSSSTM